MRRGLAFATLFLAVAVAWLLLILPTPAVARVFSTGGSYSIDGTIGQADAGSLSGASIANYNIYLPLVRR